MARASSSSLEPPSKRKRSSGSHESSRERKERRGSTSSRGSESEADSVASSSSTASSSKKRKSKSSSSKDRHGVDSRAPYLSQVPLSSAFELQYPILTLSIPPVHASQPMVALVELFDSLVMRFVPPLNGILISHGTAYFMVDEDEAGKNAQGALVDHQWMGAGPSALIGADAAFATSKVAVECCVWRPKVGMKVEGTITLSTPSHVSLLVYATFNASISSDHMTDYEFIESSSPPADGAGQTEGEEGAGAGETEEDYGYWRHKVTRERLGASTGGRVQFAIVSLTISPPSLSLSGSLLDRPFEVAPPRTVGHSAGSGGWTPSNAAAKGMQKEDREAIKKATRRVRWEEDDEESEEEEGGLPSGGGGPEIKAGKHVKF